MADSPDVILGRIDERTRAMQTDIAEIKGSQSELYSKANSVQTQVDILETQHNEHLKQCSMTIYNSPALSVPRVIALLGGGGFAAGLVGGAALITKILKWW